MGDEMDRILGTEPDAGELLGEHGRRRPRATEYQPIPDSDLRLRILNHLNTVHLEAMNVWTQDSVRALVAVMDLHRPWRHEKYVFEQGMVAGTTSTHIGCRSCNWDLRSDCPTIHAIARNLGIQE